MHWFHQLAMRGRMLLGRKQADEELNRELLFHLERQLEVEQ